MAAAIAFGGVARNSWGWILTIAALTVAINYLLGDLFILPAFGNTAGSLGDGIIAAVTAYAADMLFPSFNTSWLALLDFGVLIGASEFFIHRFLVGPGRLYD